MAFFTKNSILQNKKIKNPMHVHVQENNVW